MSDHRPIAAPAPAAPAPVLDPECRPDSDDPDWHESDPLAWPRWTDRHRYEAGREGGDP